MKTHYSKRNDGEVVMRKDKTLNKLIKNATGKIEIVVGGNFEINTPLPKMGTIVRLRSENDRNSLINAAKGDYIFELEQCDYEDFGYDTKLKWKNIK